MARTGEGILDCLVSLIRGNFQQVRILHCEARTDFLHIEAYGNHRGFRVRLLQVVKGRQLKYAFYVLKGDSIITGFDNAVDWRAIKLKYGKDYTRHLKERVPHQHTYLRAELRLTSEMDVLAFVKWLREELEEYLAELPEGQTDHPGR